MTSTHWSPWSEHYAFLPTRLRVTEWVRTNNLEIQGETHTRWIWLKRYYKRQKLAIYMTIDGAVTDTEYAFDLFEILKKS